MHRSVRAIFFTLIGTVALIVVASLFTEIINVSLSGIQLQQNIRMACEKSITLFAQESYKERTDTNNLDSTGADSVGGSINVADIVTSDGTFYISGTFYNGTDVPTIYNDLYAKTSGSDFDNWVGSNDVDGDPIAGNWMSIDLLNTYLNGTFPVTTQPNYNVYISNPSLGETRYNEDMEKYTQYLIAKSYVDTYMTPLNFGVPYIDIPTVDKMFKWNVTQLLSNYNKDLIVEDELGRYCVQVDGFRIYTSEAYIDNIEYRVFDLEDTSERAEFIAMTNIDPNNLGFEDDSAVIKELLGIDSDERKRICIIGVNYYVPISYVGISPIKNIFKWVWTNEVEGYGDTYNTFTQSNYVWNDSRDNLEGGGFAGNRGTLTDGVLPVPGDLIFYLVR